MSMFPNFSRDIKLFIKQLPEQPGIYMMVSADETILYIGKARNLKNRVSNYFRTQGITPKQAALMQHTFDINFTLTHTEGEALILENNLIKKNRPRYNILLRDDKSYPYIYMSTGSEFPRLSFYRGARRLPGRFFGPYPSAHAVRQSLNLLQKLFPVRQCEDSFFQNRSRPCLQYQIKRCTAPCVGLISAEAYAIDLQHALMFLEGRSQDVINELAEKMQMASAAEAFETAAKFRDQIQSLRKVCEHQYIDSEQGDLDIIAAIVKSGHACVQVFSVRGGRNLGAKSFYPKVHKQEHIAEVISSFLSQYYIQRNAPREIIISDAIDDFQLLENAFSEKQHEKITISWKVRAHRAKWLQMAQKNVVHAFNSKMASNESMTKRLEALVEVFDLNESPQRLECFDVSHTSGQQTVASCVVFGIEGAISSDYRRFNITNVEPGDDYAAMRQAIERRYIRLKKGEGKIPDILVIDGGKGQVAEATQVLDELQVTDVLIMGIAKGPDRKPGQERIFLSNSAAQIILPEDSPALHLIQQIRDEAHRFAIAGHRSRRSKKQKQSVLESIPGMGPKRRQTLLTQFGGLQQIKRAGVEDLASVNGISNALAQKIYNAFHSN